MAIDETDRPDGTVGAQSDDDPAPDAASRYSADDFRLRLDSPLFHRDPGMQAAQAPKLRELTWEHVVRPSNGHAHEASEAPAAERSSSGQSIEALLEQARAAAEPRSTIETTAEPLLAIEPLPPIEPLLPMEPRLPTTPMRLRDERDQRTAPAAPAPAVTAPAVTVPAVTVPAVTAPATDGVTARVDPVVHADLSDGSGDTIDLTAWLESASKSKPAASGQTSGELPMLSLLSPTSGATSAPPTDDSPQIESLLAALEQMDEVQSARTTGGAADAEEAAPAAEPSIDDLFTARSFLDEPLTNESLTDDSFADEVADELADEVVEPAVVEPAIVEPAVVEPSAVEQPVLQPASVPDDETGGIGPGGFGPVAASPPVENAPAPQAPVQEAPSYVAPVQQAPAAADRPVPERPAPKSAVEAELNRLAFLPDQEDEPGPVAVPAIAYSDQRFAPEVPALSQHQMFTPKASVAPAPSRMNLVDVSASFTPAKRKQKKGLFGRLVMILLVVGLLGGGVFAAKYYLLDKHWAGDVKALAGEVEKARGLEFDHAIEVTTLPPREYATTLATTALGVTATGRDALVGEWRAMGLLQGELNLETIGLAAMPDSPAYYDPVTETIFVADEMPADLYRFAVHRALTLALLDQHYGWGSAVKDASAAVAHGMRAYYDADALATATSFLTATERTQVFTEIFGLYAAYAIPASPSPFASTVAGRLGVALEPYFLSTPAADRTGVAKDSVVTDGQVLDLRRLLAGTAAAASTDARGMLYWYHLLASRVDDNTAWQAALAWQNDLVTWGSGAGGRCVDARLQVDPAALDRVNAALDQWAAAAPAASGTAVTRTTDGSPMQLQIVSCDPGPGVPTNDGHGYLALGGAPLRAEQFHLLRTAQPTLPEAQVACAVYGDDPVSMVDERGVIDPAEGWGAPANHPTPDPNRLGCAPAA